ncbi:MAG: sialidase family protein [Tepidisphaeraceae bacterium]
MASTMLAVGTTKGVFLYRSNESRDHWTREGPFLPGWEISALHLTPEQITIGTAHYAYGATLRTSTDGGANWNQPDGQPKHPEGSEVKTKRVWQIASGHSSEPNTLLCGLDEAALFVSRDRGNTWAGVEAINAHPTRSKWFPGAGGLCLHTIVADHSNPQRMWIGISAAGVFGTTDGGASWRSMNAGIKPLNTGSDDDAVAHCVHKMVQHPTDPNTLYMQFHGGLYRSTDGGENWTACENGVHSNFGFPMVITRAGELFIVPLQADLTRFFTDGKVLVYKSTDGGGSWTAKSKGLPQTGAFSGVLRDAMAVDSHATPGVYFGTTSGDVFASNDAGESWMRLPGTLPRVLTVRALAQT